MPDAVQHKSLHDPYKGWSSVLDQRLQSNEAPPKEVRAYIAFLKYQSPTLKYNKSV